MDHKKQLSEVAIASKKDLIRQNAVKKNKINDQKRKETISQKRKMNYHSHAVSILKRKKWSTKVKPNLSLKVENINVNMENLK